jgi:hypothetical protein
VDDATGVRAVGTVTAWTGFLGVWLLCGCGCSRAAVEIPGRAGGVLVAVLDGDFPFHCLRCASGSCWSWVFAQLALCFISCLVLVRLY